MTLAAVILAAGASRRLGSPKALVRIGERTVLERLVAAAAALGPERRTLVVTGAHHAEIAAFVADLELDVEVQENGRWEAGRTGTVAFAAAHRPGDDLLVAPVDVPLVPRTVVASLAAAWAAAGAPGSGWLAPAIEGTPHFEGTDAGRAPAARRFGHPVVLGRDLARRARDLAPDAPLRDLRAAADPLLATGTDDPAVLDDLDTPEDLARLRRRVTRG